MSKQVKAKSKPTQDAFGGLAARERKGPLWKFASKNDGSFSTPDPDFVTGLYFPLFNIAGMKCSVTPAFKGDICAGFHEFLSIPQVTEDFHISKASRNFWVFVEGHEPWSTTGTSASSAARKWTDHEKAKLEAGFGWFKTVRTNDQLGLEATATAYVPATDDMVEIMMVAVKNIGSKSTEFIPTSVSPIFGRTADNVRDHRQVTSMFNECTIHKHGIIVKARIHHDERGHKPNKMNYAVLACTDKGAAPKDIWSNLKEFIGEGGSLDNPESVVRNLPPPEHGIKEGVEMISATRFAKTSLKPGETRSFIVIRGISEDRKKFDAWIEKFGTEAKAEKHLSETVAFWNKMSNELCFDTENRDFDNLMRWIAFQPFCRKVYGNSYLPDHDYGRGGRGWRDLWSDLAALFLVDPADTKNEIINGFLGIRLDGTNATIIGTKIGEFVADRNNIARTWCDHGTWPFFILRFYIDQTGDVDILFKEITYWKDQFTHRGKVRDGEWNETQGNQQIDVNGSIYKGTIIEHVLLQQLSAFYHVGKHNNLLLEGADWNDTYDMARDKGESVCFFNWYGHNLKTIAELLEIIDRRGTHEIPLLSEIAVLLDRIPGQTPVNYDSPEDKQMRLREYFDKVKHAISGTKSSFKTQAIAADLRHKADFIYAHIRKNEFVTTKDGEKFFNGHYDNDSVRVDGDTELGTRMDLTSQVFPTLFGIATDQQVGETYRSVLRYLRNKPTGGLRLCTDFHEIKLNFGRVTGFVYGWREHGSIWSQMNVMYMYALYARNFVREGWSVFKEMYDLCMKSEQSRVFPNLPSCFHISGKGLSCYLTGSATWLVLAMVSQVFGIRGHLGDLCVNPKLIKEQFGKQGKAAMRFNMHGKRYSLTYVNKNLLDWDKYRIASVSINGTALPRKLSDAPNLVMISKADLLKMSGKPVNTMEVVLE
jgi:cellobiose phosphorylase